MSSKRQAVSPAEKLPQTKKTEIEMFGSRRTPPPAPTKQAQAQRPAKDPSKGSLIRFEVLEINGKQFFGSLSEIEIIYIWEKVLGRSKDEIFAMSYNRSLTRNFKVTFKLCEKVETFEIYPEATFEFHRARDSGNENDFDVLLCRFIGYSSVKPAEIGQLTRITVKTNDFTIEADQILPWLAKFGSVAAAGDYERNSVGVRSDVFETEILLKEHVPEYLPIAGRKALVNYPGIPRSCNNCYGTGHVKRSCKSRKKEWVQHVKEMRATGRFEDEIFGGWIAIIEREA
jgi:hypothetical protein